jgi:hypothetical protein
MCCLSEGRRETEQTDYSHGRKYISPTRGESHLSLPLTNAAVEPAPVPTSAFEP